MSQAQYEPTPPAPSSWPPPTPTAGQSVSRLLGVAGLVLGLLGLGIGTAAWFRAAPRPEASYSTQEVADAKKAVCEAYAKGVRSMRVVAGRVVDNPAEVLPVAVNSRLAEVAVANYYINALSANPAVPSELQNLLLRLSQAYQDVALIQLADGTPLDYKSEKEIVNESVAKLDQSCQ